MTAIEDAGAIADARWGDRLWGVEHRRGHFVAEVLQDHVDPESIGDDDWPDTDLFDALSGEAFPDEEPPCVRCGLIAEVDGPDPCIGMIPDAEFACCGHGIDGLGYISWTNGTVTRGHADCLAVWGARQADGGDAGGAG